MYNPLPLLTPGLLQDELAKGKCLFIRQTYPRGMEKGLKVTFLLRAYPIEEKDTAEEHLAMIGNDKTAFLYNASLPEHLEKLTTAAKQPTGYKVFYVGRKGVEWDPPPLYKKKMRLYILSRHSAWLPQEKGEKIYAGLHEKFGQLFLKFSYKKEEDTIPFDLIEKY